MKHILTAGLIAAMSSLPASAQDTEAPESSFSEGIDLFAEGARLIMEGLRDEMEPMLEELRPYLEEEMLPFLQSLGEMMDDITAYEMPEQLPNGDIIIRRRPDQPDLPEVGEGGEVEL